MREMLATHIEILFKIEKIVEKIHEHDDQLLFIFKYLEQLELSRQQQKELTERKRIGFRQDD